MGGPPKSCGLWSVRQILPMTYVLRCRRSSRWCCRCEAWAVGLTKCFQTCPPMKCVRKILLMRCSSDCWRCLLLSASDVMRF